MKADVTRLPAEKDLPQQNEEWTVYRDYLKGLAAHDAFFERGERFISWLQGTALNRALASDKRGRGDYSKILASIGMKESTAYDCRCIAAQFTAKLEPILKAEPQQPHFLRGKIIEDAYQMPTEMAEELGITSRPFVVECRDGTRFCAPEASYLWVLPMTLQRLTGENE